MLNAQITVGPTVSIFYPSAPFLITPDPFSDNGPAIRIALLAGYRWIQINGAVCPISSTVELNSKNGTPYDWTIIEPAPGIDKVTIDSTGIGRNSTDPTDPSYAVFDYEGNVRKGSFLTAPVAVNTEQIYVADLSRYKCGDWVVISDCSTDFERQWNPLDGTVEVRKVLNVSADFLILNAPTKRAHPVNAVVALFTPIQNVLIRNFEFSGNSAVGIHMHYARNCVVQNITSRAWSGRVLVLMDAGGSKNLLIDCYCTGTDAGSGASQNAWGIIMEGQDSSRMVRCGGERCGNGSAINYSIDTVSLDARARNCNVNVGVYTSSIRSGFLRPRSSAAIILASYLGPDCIDCFITELADFDEATTTLLTMP